VSAEELVLMKQVDQLWTAHPFYGSRRLRAALLQQGVTVNRKHMQRIMEEMGLEAIYAKPRTSESHPGHRKYPYLLSGVEITRPNQVWSADITYIPLRSGFAFLMAIIDWYSRYVVSWELSTTMDTDFCLRAAERALAEAQPDIFNTDQGSQFTSDAFTKLVLDAGSQVSMDGRGRAFDNIFVERLWRSVKYEEVYLHDYEAVAVARSRLRLYFLFYNDERPHQSLKYRTPAEVHWAN
jgi:putative transposase